jgi:hypothetical protein
VKIRDDGRHVDLRAPAAPRGSAITTHSFIAVVLISPAAP